VYPLRIQGPRVKGLVRPPHRWSFAQNQDRTRLGARHG
jgi:hypothetical protein